MANRLAPSTTILTPSGGVPVARRSGARRTFRVRQRHLLGGVLVLLVGTVTVLPIVFVIASSFNVARPGDWAFGLKGWIDAFGSPRSQAALFYSALLSIRAPIAVAVAFLISWMLIRVQIPGRTFIEFALWIAFFLPALPITLGWVLLLDENNGIVNALLKGAGLPPVPVHSVIGILWVHLTVATVPVMTILLAPAFRMMDASMEEASRTCGSTNWQTLRRVTLPLLLPAILTALVAGLVRSLEAFEIEQILGTRVGIHVYATRIYDLISFDNPQFPQAMALSTVSLGVLSLLAFAYQRIVSSRNYVTVSARGMSTRPLLVGRWRYLVSGAMFTYIAVGIALPIALLVIGSFMRLFGFFSIDAPLTTKHWESVLGSPTFGTALRNSIVLGLSASLLGIVVYTALGYTLARSNLAGRRLLGLLVWLPWAIPGMLLGVALLWLLLSLPAIGWLYGTIGALLFALLIKELPLGVNLTSVAFMQLSRELEHSSRVCGASWLTTYRRVLLPLIAPMLASIFSLTFIGALRDISTTALLVTPGNRSLAQLMFQLAVSGSLESACVVGIIIASLAIIVAFVVRRLGLTMGVA